MRCKINPTERERKIGQKNIGGGVNAPATTGRRHEDPVRRSGSKDSFSFGRPWLRRGKNHDSLVRPSSAYICHVDNCVRVDVTNLFVP